MVARVWVSGPQVPQLVRPRARCKDPRVKLLKAALVFGALVVSCSRSGLEDLDGVEIGGGAGLGGGVQGGGFGGGTGGFGAGGFGGSVGGFGAGGGGFGGGGFGGVAGSPNDCCVASQTPSCSDSFIAQCVCSTDPFCCESAWDS